MAESLTGRALGPEWKVASHTSEELVLEHLAPGGIRKVGGALTVSVGSLAIALSLFFATPEDARLITWPVAALLVIVSALGFPAAVRNLQRARLGLRLRFSRDGVEGWPLKLASFGPSRHPKADVKSVTVQSFQHPPLTLVMLEVVLNDGTRLTGPELAVETGAKHPLDPVAAAARAFL
ncbi:MAG TPA: hypothetical protein VGE37_05770 [Archangium sp.]